MEELEIGDYINDINSYHLHMFDKHDVTTKKLDVIVEKARESGCKLRSTDRRILPALLGAIPGKNLRLYVPCLHLILSG